MTDYSFRTEIIWPVIPEIEDDEKRRLMEKLASSISEKLFKQICGDGIGLAPRVVPSVPCCRGPVLHEPSCKYWCTAT